MQATNGTRTFSAADAAVAFPLGGIGTGNVSLGARGDLRDWEIFNHPGKGTRLPNTFFAIRAQAGAAPAVVRMLEGLLSDLRMQYVSLVNSPQQARRFSGSDITGGR